MKLAGTRLRNHPSRKGLTNPSKAGPVWNGKLRFNEEWLTQPLRWKRPRKIFVCAHGDLFHESAPDEWIDRVFAVMALCPQHQFQVLTKRAERMRAYFKIGDSIADSYIGRVCGAVDALVPWRTDASREARHNIASGQPLPNVWLGVSAERQQEADERIPHLLQTPAAIRFVSCEPLLGPIDLTNLGDITMSLNAFTGEARHLLGMKNRTLGGLDWIIAGGESGPGARPMHPDWARSLRDQCAAALPSGARGQRGNENTTAGVPFFFKQWGAYGEVPNDLHPEAIYIASDGRVVEEGDSSFRDSAIMVCLGKKAAGRLLDGREHNGMPAIRAADGAAGGSGAEARG